MLPKNIQTWAMSLIGLAIASPLTASWVRGEPEYREGEVLVKFRRGFHETAARQAAQEHNLAARRVFRGLSARRGQAYVHLVSTTETTAQLLKRLQKDPRVEAVEPNYLQKIEGPFYPNDTFFTNLWWQHNTGQKIEGSNGVADADIDAPEAWALHTDGTGEVVVAVADTGVYYTHPDLQPVMWRNPGEIPGNGMDDDGNGYVDDVYGYDFAGDGAGPPDSCPMDVGTHGTHVAGIIAGAINNQWGVAGLSRAKIMAVKISWDGSLIDEAAAVEAIDYVSMMKARGVNVVAINCSFGGTTPNFAERDAIEDAGALGIVVCAAAGNNSMNCDLTPFYPSCFKLSNILSIASTDNRDRLSYFSNYGATNVHLAAPGSSIFSTIAVEAYNTVTGTLKVVSSGSTYTVMTFAYSGCTTGITAMARYYTQWTNLHSATGEIAVMKFDGGVANGAQTLLAMNAGCVAAVIHSTALGFVPDATLGAPDEWIPTANMQLADRNSLTSQLPAVVTLKLDGPIAYKSGTSMATPVVAGAVAMMAMQFPGDTVAQRMNRLLTSVDPNTNLTGKVSTGGRLNVLNATDTDHDGVGDWWEMRYFGSLSGTLATYQNRDTDGDGLSDYEEFLAGSSPTASDNAFEVTAPSLSATNGFALRWNSINYRTYSVERTTNLSVPFGVLASNIAATPPQNVYWDTAATNSLPGSFYRVRVQ